MRPPHSAGKSAAAEALSRCQLFSSLGRLELARLSGELDEISLDQGEVLFTKGDPGDAFYVIRAGQARIGGVGGEDSSAPILINAGQVIGEMAILTGDPRSASISAHSHLDLWRMTAERFLLLLEKDRKIALSIEKTLSLRLRDATQRQASANQVGHMLLHAMDDDMRHLMVCLSARARWPRLTVELLIEAGGLNPTCLDMLLSYGQLLHWDEGHLVMAPLLGEALAAEMSDQDRAILRELSRRLIQLAQFEEAIDMLFLAGDARAALAAMIEHAEALRSHAPIAMLDIWLSALSRDGLDQTLIETAQRALDVGDDADDTIDRHALTPTTADKLPLWRRVRGVKTLAVIMALTLLAAGWLAPAPADLGRPGFAALLSIAATLPLMMVEILPNYIVTVMLAAALVIPGIVPATVALSGFSSSSWMMMAILFAISGAIARSGLMYRLALLMLKRLPGNLIVLSLSLLGLSAVLTTGIANAGGRANLAAPSVRDLADAMRLKARSPGAVLLGVCGFQMFVGMGSLFITASSSNLMLVGMLPEPFRAQTSWVAWFLAAVVPHILLFALLLPTLFLIYRPKISNPVDHGRLDMQLALLGSVTRQEKLSVAALVLLGVGFATRPLHGIPDVWVAFIVCVLFFATRILNDKSFQSNVNWGTMIYSGILMGLSHVLSSIKVDGWLIDLAGSTLSGTLGNPYIFVTTIAVLTAVMRFMVPSKTLSPLVALVAIPLAISAGYNPLVAVLVVLIAADHAFLPFLNESYPTFYHGMGGFLFSDRQVRPALWAETGLRIVALIASVPIWRAMGLIV